MNKLFLIALMFAIATQQPYTTQCLQCGELLSPGDCAKMSECSWEATMNTCGISKTPMTPTITYKAYCDQFTEADCSKESWAACAWDEGKCIQFTGCTIYQRTTDKECQSISNRCITDGTHCVELDACNTYTKEIPCKKNAIGSLCYWDTTKSACVDANKCERLPAAYKTDADCRTQISTCTIKIEGGCIDSGTNCSDQILEIQCIWDKLKSQRCYWDTPSQKCINKTCDAAPVLLKTDDKCKIFLEDGSCTTKSGGGCVVRGACTDAIQAACIKDINDGDCYWNAVISKCVPKICKNAPESITTNSACKDFAPTPKYGCIAKLGGGCMLNDSCSVAGFKEACVKNSSGVDCIWDTTCKEKTCENAPTSNNTHELCTTYLPTCTVKTGGGCQPRKCSNAPTSITTNESCETYLPNNKCITIPNGGCTVNTTCAAILQKTACVKDANNNVCIYDDLSSTCKDKTCPNAPADNITHELCQKFSTSCTVSSSTIGCVTWTCQNVSTIGNCIRDYNRKACIWKGKCYKKQCALAPSTTSTHNDCNTYLNTCTLSNTGYGCVPIPLKCEAITIEAACQVRQGGAICGWNGTVCIDKACSTAPNTNITTTDCNSYKSGCVSANPVNGQVSGCIDLPTTCAARLSSDNCSQGNSPNCLWNTTTVKCVEKTCNVATDDGIPGKVQASAANCNSFLHGCLVSDDETKCITKVNSCSSLHSPNNCIKHAKADGIYYCFWDGTKCLDRTCSNINKTTHSQCNYELDTCTVNAMATGCLTLAIDCSYYLIQEQCKFNSAGKFCVWNGTVCRNATCYDANDSSTYDSDSECEQYKAVTDICTVVYKVGGQGCVPRSANCSDYYVQQQCYKTLSNKDCVWVNNGCYSIKTWAVGECSTFKGTQESCEKYRVGCTNQPLATSTSQCEFDCSKKVGTGFTHAECQTFNKTCTSDKRGANCQAAVASCSGYGSYDACSYTKTGTKCQYISGSCFAIPSAAYCVLITTETYFSHAICQSYNILCTVNSFDTACQAVGACNSYVDETQCSYNQNGLKCFWYNDGFNFKCIQITASTDCSKVTGFGLNHAYCKAYNGKCFANAAGTACQLQNCGDFLNSATCLTQGDLKCYWYSTTSICISIATSSTDCAKITETGLTHDTCSSYNSDCVANAAGTACQESLATCMNYTAGGSDACSKSDAGLCVWNSGVCVAIAASGDCAKVTGTGLTSAQCQAYNTACRSNASGTACEPVVGCGDYTTSETCLNFAAVKCYWYTNAGTSTCVAITTAATDCLKVTGTGLTNAQCTAYQPDCVANAGGTACQESLATCGDYTAIGPDACTKADTGSCFWYTNAGTSTCITITITTASTDCLKVTGTGLTDATCNDYNAACTVNSAGTACQEALACSAYTASTSCSFNRTGLACLWYNFVCYMVSSVTDCEKVTGTNLTDDQCQAYNQNCKAAAATGATSCILVTKCGDIRAEDICTQVGTTQCYWYNSVKCIAIVQSSDCSKVQASGLTFDNCQSYNKDCSVNRAGTACIALQATCSEYDTNLANCVKSAAGVCVSNAGETRCQEASQVETCEEILLGPRRYTNDNCNAAKSGCTNDSSTGCTARTCANYSGTFNHTNCNSWLNTCTVNSFGTACSTMANTCSSQDGNYTACLQAIEGACIIQGIRCVKKTCDTAANDYSNTSDSACSAYLSTCTVASFGGCQPRAACATYKSSIQCMKNASGQSCFWNPTQLTCVDLSCSNVEATSSFDTHAKCMAVDSSLKCTVRAQNGAAVPGCINRGACSSYTIEDQCKINDIDGVCAWNTNFTIPACQDKGCTTAPNSIATHDACFAYYISTKPKVYCTVVAIPNPGRPTFGGCQNTAACSSYIAQEQCKINSNGDPCGWNGQTCADKSCATAQPIQNTDLYCRNYLSTCTVADSGQGCIDIPVDCSSLGSIHNCIKNKSGAQCYWTGSSCQTRTCDNAPDSTASAEECNTHLVGCTLDTTKCKTKICEDFPYTTDLLCRAALSTCTTDGTKCVTRGTCLQALSKAGCITSAPIGKAGHKACQWMAATSTEIAYCTERTCETAPIILYRTEASCASYFTNCTTKSGGGCVTKTTCTAANVEAACTTALDGTVCQWHNKACRNKDCQDFTGSTHSECQGQRSGCTVGANGKCAKVKNCEDTTIRAACIQGSNGPCLWVSGYANSDGTKGACFSYTSCKSLKWNSDGSCKLASQKCTTDGSKCVGISLCAETNTAGGCVTGYDGDCIQSIAYLTSPGPAICKRYQSCADAYYLTHTECQQASLKCTTNGSTGCIALAPCSTYPKAGCYKNKIGPTQANGLILSTGLCEWADWPSVCRDQICEDLVGTTHAQCISQLSTCTSDGTNCLVKGNCSTYATQTACVNAEGADGICHWKAESSPYSIPECTLMTCNDIANGTSTSFCKAALSSCVSDGNNCISKANCWEYKTKTSCRSDGLDGLCVFIPPTATNSVSGAGICYVMTTCKSANDDESACAATKGRCKWIAATATNTSSCVPHTCASYQATNGVCSNYLNLDKKTQQICLNVNGICTAIDPSALSSDNCYLVSGYTYTWNASSSECQVCGTVPVNQSNSTTSNVSSNVSTTNSTNTSSGYIFGFTSVFLGFIAF